MSAPISPNSAAELLRIPVENEAATASNSNEERNQHTIVNDVIRLETNDGACVEMSEISSVERISNKTLETCDSNEYGTSRQDYSETMQNDNENVQHENEAVLNENEAVQNEIEDVQNVPMSGNSSLEQSHLQNENKAIQNKNKAVQNDKKAVQNKNEAVQYENENKRKCWKLITCKLCKKKYHNLRPSLARHFHLGARRSSSLGVMGNISKISKLTKTNLKQYQYLFKHQLSHTSSYIETLRLNRLLKVVELTERTLKH